MAPRACQAENTVQEYFEQLHKTRAAAEVGVLVGKPSVGSRDILVALVRTPPDEETGQDAVTVAGTSSSTTSTKAKKGSSASQSAKAATAASLSASWVGVHAAEVARHLPGGLSVLGLYLFAPEAAFTALSGQLSLALATIHTSIAAEAAPAVAAAPSSQPQELLLLFVDSDSRKQSLRSRPAPGKGSAAAPAALTPCELKYGSALPSFVRLTATHRVDASLLAMAAGEQLQQGLKAVADSEAARIMAAVAAIHGRVPDDSTVLNDLIPPTASTSEAVDVQLYCAPSCCSSNTRNGTNSRGSTAAAGANCTTATSHGQAHLMGLVTGVAYAHKREPAARALADLKADLAKSLHLRITLEADQATAAAEEAAKASTADGEAPGFKEPRVQRGLMALVRDAKQESLPLMRRVLLPWQGGLVVSGYVGAGEPLGDLVEVTAQVMGEGIQQTVEVETSGEAKAAAPAMPPKAKAQAAPSNATGDSKGTCSNATLAAAAAAGAVAVLAGVLGLMGLGSQ